MTCEMKRGIFVYEGVKLKWFVRGLGTRQQFSGESLERASHVC
jgi:hypothetical protein